MRNIYVKERLEALIKICKSVDSGGKNITTASKGTEREFFINQILSNVIAPPFRIGTGDITDSTGKRSGQCDLIIEYTHSISFPLISPRAPRLYFAEGVCAVIEIKSDLGRQWNEVQQSHEFVAQLKRRYSFFSFTSTRNINEILPEKIPYFVIGYRGWKKKETLKEKMMDLKIDGILVLESALYYGKEYEGEGSEALFAFLRSLQILTGEIMGAIPDYDAY